MNRLENHSWHSKGRTCRHFLFFRYVIAQCNDELRLHSEQCLQRRRCLMPHIQPRVGDEDDDAKDTAEGQLRRQHVALLQRIGMWQSSIEHRRNNNRKNNKGDCVLLRGYYYISGCGHNRPCPSLNIVISGEQPTSVSRSEQEDCACSNTWISRWKILPACFASKYVSAMNFSAICLLPGIFLLFSKQDNKLFNALNW